jgi:hypothetical protein
MPNPRSSAARRLSQLATHRGTHGRAVRDFRDGGHVRGPGTPTSDSIDARLSDEEYVLPADTVKAVGVSALDALRKATHRPTKRSGQGYADGGQVKVENVPRPNSFGDAAAAAQSPGVVLVPSGGGGTSTSSAPAMQTSLAPSPVQPSAASAQSPVRAAFDSVGLSGRSNSFGDAAAVKQDSTVSLVRTGASAVDQIPTSGNRSAPAADGSQNSPFNTEVGRNIMNSAAALPGLGGVGQVASTGGRISSAFNAASRAVNVGSGVAAGEGLPVVSAGSANAATSSSVDVGRTASAHYNFTPGNAGRGGAIDRPDRTDVDPNDPRFGRSRNFTNELNAVPDNLPKDMRSGVVLKTIDPKTGRVTYSGRDVGLNGDGQVQMVDGMGRDLKMLGKPTGNYVQGLDANGKPNSFAAPGMDGAIQSGANQLRGGGPQTVDANKAVATPSNGSGSYASSALRSVGNGAISARNMQAADALASRNDGSSEIRAAMNKEQYDREVAGAQAFNQAQFDRNNPMSKNQAATQGIRLQQRQLAADQKLEQAKFDLVSQGTTLDNQSKARLGLLQAKVANGTSDERSSAAEALRAISGKEKLPRWSLSTVQGGSDADGVKQPGYAVMGDQASGAYKIIAPGKQDGPSVGPKYPEGQVLSGKDGKTYVVKNGVPVLK